ncbi:hypothetical protein M0R45_035971 [Rubus argutus]|uniref:START domain-containing protein n=1 Tax=Rubus argutus TaxID=59490 RepID=A0AAW1VYJ6_RUBAR
MVSTSTYKLQVHGCTIYELLCVLYSLVASTPIVPEPQPEPQPQVPIQVAELPALPEALPEGGFLDMIHAEVLFRPPGVQQQPRVDVNPPQPEFLEVSSDDSIDQELLWGDIRDFMPTSTEHSLMLVPSEDLPGPAHDLVGVPAEEVSSIVRRARDEFIFMATAGYPLWVSSDSNAFHPETLNYGEYLRMSQRGIPAPFFQSEASRDTATIRVSPITIVQTLMEVDQWLHIFCSMVTNAQILEVLSPGEEESYKERKQVMSAELVLTTPYVPAREAQFVRYSHQQLDGSWIVVDVSVDELRQFHRPSTRSVCRKRPSGCLIRDMQNGSSLVTWVENVDVREKEDEMHAILKPFVESSFAFGASRWISTLQRQAERFIYSTGINISPSDAPISPEGRRSLTMTANKMVVSFCNDICNSTYHHWTSSNKTRQKNYGGQDQQAKG